MFYTEDTICALATAIGGAVAIIRLSGPDAVKIAAAFWKGRGGINLASLPQRSLVLGTFKASGNVIDPSCLAVKMLAPNSYTGEDVVELHCHGGAVCSRAILRELLRDGARLAEAGEFSKRGFINGKMDLTQAEAVSDMVSAGSEAALKLAARQLQGGIGKKVKAVSAELKLHLADVESRLDFPEEELDWSSADSISDSLKHASCELSALAATRDEGELLRDGVSLVIAGPPNVGKSSLLNLILGRERAIVSNVPGTTRDTIEASVQLRGIPFHLVDTAGVRIVDKDEIEKAGIARTKEAAAAADLVIWVVDGTMDFQGQLYPEDWNIPSHRLFVANKQDLPCLKEYSCGDFIQVSAATGFGMERLFEAMEEQVLGGRHIQSDISVAARHASLLEEASVLLREAANLMITGQMELVAIPLRSAILRLGEITGETVKPDVLDTIFSRFCIGK